MSGVGEEKHNLIGQSGLLISLLIIATSLPPPRGVHTLAHPGRGCTWSPCNDHSQGRREGERLMSSVGFGVRLGGRGGEAGRKLG